MAFRPFRKNSSALSLLYDAVFFLVLVSLSGVILLPALRSPIAVESSVEKRREQVVDDALHTYLISRCDEFTYLFCGDLLDSVAGSLGINTTQHGLYTELSEWLLAHEQRHKTYASLLVEDLGCQFHVPSVFPGVRRLNLLTAAFDTQLRNDTNRFFSQILGERYEFNMTAWWHPIRGVDFGGELSVGPAPPSTDTYVSRHLLAMPYSPVFHLRNQTVILTKDWLTHHLFGGDVSLGRSSIPSIANITLVLENYTNKHAPFDDRAIASAAVQENLSILVYGFLIDGVSNETNETVFPGIVDITLTYGFENIKNMTSNVIDRALNESFGAVIRTMDSILFGLNASVANPLSSMILQGFNATFGLLTNGSYDSFDDLIIACETELKEHVTGLLKTVVDPLIASFVHTIFDGVDLVKGFEERLVDWLCDRISIATAEVTLTIWPVRE